MRTSNLSLTVSLMFVVCAYSFAGEFFDDFEDTEKTETTWEVIHRDWEIKGGAYFAPGAAGLTQDAISLLPIEVEDGMVIEAQCGDAGDGNWSNFAVVYAYEEEDLVWSAGAGVGNDQWRIFQFTPIASKGGAWGVDAVAGVAVKKPLEPNNWYNIRLEISGKIVKLFGSSTPESEDLKEENEFEMNKAPKGRIGLGSAGAAPSFNWIRVTGKNVVNLFSVDPQGKLATTWGKVKRR